MPNWDLTRSVWYDREYNFSQTAGGDAAVDADVAAAHGVCAVCAIDWLLAKITGTSFVYFGRAGIATKRLMNQDAVELMSTWDRAYALWMPNQTLGTPARIELNAAGGTALADQAVALADAGTSARMKAAAHEIAARVALARDETAAAALHAAAAQKADPHMPLPQSEGQLNWVSPHWPWH